jgi:hypothetical protein
MEKPREVWGNWEGLWDRIADIHWGLVLFGVLVVLLLIGQINGDDVRGFSVAAGLLGVGHGIHTGTKHGGKPRRTR